ncbi:hypothetical protein MTO96_043644 [Rhipicephalus appendiculatus]
MPSEVRLATAFTAADQQHQTALKVLLPPVADGKWPQERLRRVAGAGIEPDSTNRALPSDAAAPDSADPSTTTVDMAELPVTASGAYEETARPSVSAAVLCPSGETSSAPRR